MAGLGIGLAVGLGPPSAGGAGGGGTNPNLLLWTENFENPVWTLTNGDIIALDQDGTADEFASTGAAAAIRQASTTAAATGGPYTAGAAMGGSSLVRFSVSGSFGGLLYIFSVMLKDTGAAAVPSLTLRLDRSGGFIRCSIEDSVGDGDFLVGYAQLEQAASFTSYHSRGGS